jgi:lauroyl/myristoyl acyltransferase
MPKIYDNTELILLDGLRDVMADAQAADMCVGYFNLRGWEYVADLIEPLEGTDEHCCRLLVGMQKPPEAQMRDAYKAIRKDECLDAPTIARLKYTAAESFRGQLAFGVPSNAAELALQRLAEHLRSGKLRVKLFLRYPLHAKLPTLPPEELADIAPIDGLEHLQASIAAGSGTILIGAHLGNWEIGPARLNQEGFDVVPLARPSSMLRIARTVDALREGMAVPTIPVHGGIRPCLRLLRKNTVIGILPDRYARGQGLDVEYMGHTTNLWHTPMLLALRSGAQMLPCNTVRQDDGSFRVYIDEPIPVTPTTPIDVGTQQVFHCLEKRVRQHPEQYLWQYDLWPDVEL